MMGSGTSRIRRHVVAGVIVGLGVGLLPASAALAAQGTSAVAAQVASSATGFSGFTTTSGSVRVGGELWDAVTVSPKAARAVTVQYRRAGTNVFKNAYTASTSARGVITLGLQPPAAGRWQFRAVVAATSRAARFVSSTRTVVASGRAVRTDISGYATTSATISLGATVTGEVVLSPRAPRAVVVQARRPGSVSFVTQSTGTFSSSGSFRAVYRPTSAGAWGFRLVVSASATALSVTSPTRIITATEAPGGEVPSVGVPVVGVPVVGLPVVGLPVVGLPVVGVPVVGVPVVDRTAPGPVTGLTVSGMTRKTATLSWTNPADADLTGAVIRRAPGATAPATVTDGTAVTDLAAPGHTVTDTGLTADMTYSYAVFAHDGTPNYAAAATLTVTTAKPVTEAVLSVRPLGLPINTDNKLTVNTPFRFDAGDSLAADGTTLVSGTLDYGDGQTDTFTVPFGPFDFWNTEHSYTATGKKTVTLTVTALNGTTDTTIVTVNVLNAPTATVRVTSGPAHVGAPVTFALDTSTPVGTKLSSFALHFAGDESFHLTDNSAPPATQNITFDLPGTYTVAFSVANDAGGAPAASVITIVVGP
jgi:hypothetical protein